MHTRADFIMLIEAKLDVIKANWSLYGYTSTVEQQMSELMQLVQRMISAQW